jgi:hypothetical protein
MKNWAHGGCDRATGGVNFSLAPDFTFGITEGPCPLI